MTMETTMTDTTNETAPTAGQLVAAKTICLVLKIGQFGNTKQAPLAGAVLSADDPTQEPDKKLLRLSKTLIVSPELVAIQKHDSALAAAIRRLAFSSLFKGGVYMIPIAMVPDIEVMLQEAQTRRQALVDAAVAAYPLRVQETTERLGSAANDRDYPSTERFRAAFYLEYSYVTFDTPTRLKAISAALFQAEVEKQRARLESVAGECQQAMRAGLAQLVDHLAERLTPGEDGKPKRLAHTTIGHLNDFLTMFELRNVTDDAELGDIVVKARAVMQGVDHKTLKSDTLIAQKVAQELADLKAALDPLITEKGNRHISFEDEDAVA
jgi:hypothetical protein